MSRWLRIFFLLLPFFLIFELSPTSGSDRVFVSLSQEERAWLVANPFKQILWYNEKFPPFEYQSAAGTFEGMSADIMRLIEQRLGTTFYTIPSRDWNAQLLSLERGESAIAPVIVRTPQRERYAFFSAPYVNVPVVIITTREKASNMTLDDFRSQRVAVVKGHVSEDFLQSEYSEKLEIVAVDNVQMGLRDVAFGVVDALVENLAVAGYYIDQEKLPNLKVSGNAGMVYPLSFAVSREYPLLFSAMQKAMATVRPDELQAIQNKWIHLEHGSFLTPEQWRGVMIAAFFAAVLVASLAVISLFLRRRLKEKIAGLDMAHQEVLESEQRFRSIFEHAPYAMMIISLEDGSLLDVNNAFVMNWGRSKKEALQYKPGDILQMPEVDAAAARLAVVERGGVFNQEAQIVRSDGSEAYIMHSSVPVTFGGTPCILSMIVDITERKKAEDALLLTQFAMDRAPDSIIWVNDEGGIAYVNDAACASMGYAREELLEMKIFDIDPDFPAAGWSRHKELLRGHGRMTFEGRHHTKDGGLFPVEVTTNYIEHKGRFFSISFDRDITERKRYEEELKRLLEEQDILLNNIDVQVWYLKDDDTYGAVNTAHAKFFGKDKHMLDNRSLREVLSSEGDVRRCMAGNRQVFEEKRQIKNEEWLINGEGESRLLAVTKTPKLDEKGAVEYVVCFASDITEAKKMQEMMVQTEKMISVGGIAAGIAHEINNPLGIVLQASQNLAQRMRPDFVKNQAAAKAIGLDLGLLEQYMRERKLDVFIQDIQTAAMRAAVIIRHMLDFTRRSESKRAVCDFGMIVNRALSLVQSDYDLKKSYDFKKIQVNLEVGDDLPMITCTETEIEQVMLNLLRNAAQAMAESVPPMEKPRIDIRITSLSDGVRIELEDNGPGIPLELQARIFEPFFTTKAPGQGTGLGLSVSYFIVTKSHGGRMQVESAPGAGTCFIIELPEETARETWT